MSVHTTRFGLYIHVPYCMKRCHYCDFFTMPMMDDRETSFGTYLRALHSEFTAQAPAFSDRTLHSIFWGGGTPSLLNPDEIAAVLELIQKIFAVGDIEITLEVNPETMDRERAKACMDAGINRFSMGIQSLRPAALELLGRNHTIDSARRCFDALREAGCSNISLDMIYGRPQQYASDWENELNELMEWQPEHVSLYELILEPGTPMTRAVNKGELTLPKEEERLRMYRLCREVTAAHGLEWYEVSNYARPGYEAQHNLDNWRGAEYLGVGPGAHSFRNRPGWGARRANPRNMPMYLERPAAAPWKERSIEDAIQETLLNGLRLREGLLLQPIIETYGHSELEKLQERIPALQEAGYIQTSPERWTLTARGVELLDSILTHLTYRA